MHNDMNRLAWLMLSQAPSIGPLTFFQLLDAGYQAADLFSKTQNQLPNFLNRKQKQVVAQHSVHPGDPLCIECLKYLRWAAIDGHHLLLPFDEDYPHWLSSIAQPPACLFVRGNVELLKQTQLAIVGGRNLSLGQLNLVQAWSSQLADQGLVITSGLALGVDAAAHKGAIVSGRTIAVLASGVDQPSPAAHRGLAEHIVANGGALVSEVPLGQEAHRQGFVRRNRIVSGLAKGVLIVGAGDKSGTLTTAQMAIEQNRDLFVMPGAVDDPNFVGSLRLLKEGASLVTEPEDILREMNIAESAMQAPSSEPDFLQFLSFEPLPIEVLAQQSGQDYQVLESTLFELEMEGWVSQSYGGYARIR